MSLAPRCPPALPVALAPLLGLALAGAARAEEAPHDEASALVAARATGALVLENGEAGVLTGQGVAVERPLGHGWAVEATIGELQGPEVSEIPVELLVEHLWVVSAHLEPYVGLGPFVAVRAVGLETEVHGGAVVVAGARWWATERVGVLLEADATAAPHSVGAEAQAGVAFRWW